MTDKQISEQKKAELALAKARDFRDGDPKPFLAQMEWEELLIKEQNELNRAVMREQHKLNKRIVIIAAIISALSGICGGLIQKYGPEFSWVHTPQTPIQIRSGLSINTEATTPPTKLHETSTTKETSSYKSPPKEKHE